MSALTDQSARRRRSSALWLLLVMAACSSKTPYPSEWPTTPMADGGCGPPTGSYANQATRSTDDITELELKQVFFADLLNGFDVTHLRFEVLTDGNIRVTPFVGSTALQEQMVLTPVEVECGDERWKLDTGWDVDGYMIATGLIWTGGVLVPAAAKGYFALALTAERQLVVHATINMAGVFALVIPFRTRIADEWFLFPAYDEPEAETAAIEASSNRVSEVDLPVTRAAEEPASEHD